MTVFNHQVSANQVVNEVIAIQTEELLEHHDKVFEFWHRINQNHANGPWPKLGSRVNKLKVLEISARADIGGGPRHLRDLAQGLRASVDLYVASPLEAPFGDEFRRLAIEHFELPKRSFRLSKAFALLGFCRKRQIQIVHSHGRGAGAYSRFLGLFGIKVVHTFHGFHRHSGRKTQIFAILERILKYFTHEFIAVSQDEMTRAVQDHVASAGATTVIFNGLPILTKEIKPTYVHSPNRCVFGVLTRFDAHKGNHLLIDFVSQLPAELKERCEFRLAGEGPEKAALEQLVQKLNLVDKIVFMGPVAEPLVFLSGVDIFASCSQGEGLSYATLEALQMGRLLLLSRVTGHTELNGLSGVFFFNLDSVPDFRAQLEKVMQAVGQIRTELPPQFQLQTMVEKTLLVYERLAFRSKSTQEGS